MDIIWYIHWLAPLSILLLPLLTERYLIMLLWYPLVYYIIWMAFDGCPLNNFTSGNNKKEDEFLLPIFKKYINENISEKQFNRLIGFFLGLSIVISSYKIIRKCKFKN